MSSPMAPQVKVADAPVVIGGDTRPAHMQAIDLSLGFGSATVMAVSTCLYPVAP